MLADVLEIASAVLMVLGGFFCFIAGLGIVRMPDVYIRMHAATKAGTLGIGLVAVSICLVAPELEIIVKALLVAVFMIMTAPVGAHLIGRAAYRAGTPFWQETAVDKETSRFTREARTQPPRVETGPNVPAARGAPEARM